jgi:cell wall-associated NlpC family hydrolase
LLQALSSLGIDYQYGGQSPTTGFDCSGLVAHVFLEAFGRRLPRSTAGQSRTGFPVAREQLEAGDLVFFNTLNRPFSHVGIYLGDGRFLHAPKAGAQVRMERIDMAYWARRFDGARRIDL